LQTLRKTLRNVCYSPAHRSRLDHKQSVVDAAQIRGKAYIQCSATTAPGLANDVGLALSTYELDNHLVDDRVGVSRNEIAP
jgi:hypothetical protein